MLSHSFETMLSVFESVEPTVENAPYSLESWGQMGEDSLWVIPTTVEYQQAAVSSNLVGYLALLPLASPVATT